MTKIKEVFDIETKTNLLSELVEVSRAIEDAQIPDRLILEMQIWDKIREIVESIEVWPHKDKS